MLDEANPSRTGTRNTLPVAAVPRDVALVTLHESRPEGADLGSTTHDGRYLWIRPAPGAVVAGDVEGLDNSAARDMAVHLGVSKETFLWFWTLLETIAKIEDVAADVLLRRHRATPEAAALSACYPTIEHVTTEIDGTVATVGWLTLPRCDPVR